MIDSVHVQLIRVTGKSAFNQSVAPDNMFEFIFCDFALESQQLFSFSIWTTLIMHKIISDFFFSFSFP